MIWEAVLRSVSCLIFLHCAFSNVSSNRLHERKQNRTGCICLTFLHCVSSNVSSNGLPQQMHNHIDCICLTFHHCVFSNVPLNCLPEKKYNHIDCICLTFPRCVLSNVPSNCLLERMQSHIDCICSIFHHCAFSYDSSKHLHTRMQSHIWKHIVDGKKPNKCNQCNNASSHANPVFDEFLLNTFTKEKHFWWHYDHNLCIPMLVGFFQNGICWQLMTMLRMVIIMMSWHDYNKVVAFMKYGVIPFIWYPWYWTTNMVLSFMQCHHRNLRWWCYTHDIFRRKITIIYDVIPMRSTVDSTITIIHDNDVIPMTSMTQPTVPSPPQTRITVSGTSRNIWSPAWAESGFRAVGPKSPKSSLLS